MVRVSARTEKMLRRRVKEDGAKSVSAWVRGIIEAYLRGEIVRATYPAEFQGRLEDIEKAIIELADKK